MEVSLKSFFHFSVEKYPLNEGIIMDISGLALIACIKKVTKFIIRNLDINIDLALVSTVLIMRDWIHRVSR